MSKRETLVDFYKDLEDEVALYEAQHQERLQCKKGCSACCVDDLTVFEVEAHHIVINCSDVLIQNPHEEGGCAFMDDAVGCRIYAHRPYVCRTQGLPLRWVDEVDAQWVEFRDICSLNETEEPIEVLPAEHCWEIGPFEGRVATLQMQASGSEMRRVFLGSLFMQGDK